MVTGVIASRQRKCPSGLVGACAIFFALSAPAAPVARARAGSANRQLFTPAAAAGRFTEILGLVDGSNAPNLIGPRKWRALVAGHRETIESSRTHAQFAAATNRLIQEAGVSHFGYYYDEQWEYWHLRGVFGDPDSRIAHAGVIPLRVDGRWHVRGILEGSPCHERDIRIGDELLSVDGLPFEPVGAFRGTADRRVTLRVRRKPGLLYNVEITPVKESLHHAMQRAMHESVRIVEHDGLHFAYLHAWTTLGPGQEYDALLEIQGDVDGLLLDYRDGFGGSWHRPLDFLLGEQRDALDRRINPQWHKPAVILTGDGTRSAKEIVVAAVKRYRRAPLVGDPSPGHVISVGGISPVGDDALLMLPGHRFALEGKPTMPDFPVARKIPYLAGADPQMRTAKQVLTDLVRPSRGRSKQRAPTH